MCRCAGRAARVFCHTCESGLISGSVVYQPEPLEPPAQGHLLICCSQPKGDVVIDLINAGGS